MQCLAVGRGGDWRARRRPPVAWQLTMASPGRVPSRVPGALPITTHHQRERIRPVKRTESPPLGESEVPGELPSLTDWRNIKLERCRRKLAAHHTKKLGAAVFEAFGEASLPVLAEQGITIDADGVVRSAGEDQVDDQFCEIYSAMTHAGHRNLFPPCDVHLDPASGVVRVEPWSHDRHEAHTHA